MPALIFLTPLLVLWYARRPPGWLFLSLYLPALMLVPDTFHTTTGGIPKVSVNQAIIVAILPIVLWRYGKFWRLSVSDVLLAALTALICVSEYIAAGYAEAQNLGFRTFATAVAPYLCVRLLVTAERCDVALARRLVGLTVIVVLICVYEFKFGYNPFLSLFGMLFPGQGTGWVTTFRYGFARIAGPFAHAILAGIMMALAYRLQRWLQWGGHWEARLRWPNLPWSKASVFTAVLVAGAVMTFARGPWIGGLLGGALLMAGRSRRRGPALRLLAVALLVVAPLGHLAMESYLEVKPGAVMTMSQESAMYRKELMERYTTIALDHALLGWGRNTWPKVGGMVSIDNYFLLLSLMHGVLVTLLLLALFVWQGARLCLHGYRAPPQANSPAFTLAGMLLAVLVSLVTVYLGEAVMPALFMVFGWAEAVLGRRPGDSGDGAGIAAAPAAAGAPFRQIGAPHFGVVTALAPKVRKDSPGSSWRRV